MVPNLNGFNVSSQNLPLLEISICTSTKTTFDHHNTTMMLLSRRFILWLALPLGFPVTAFQGSQHQHVVLSNKPAGCFDTARRSTLPSRTALSLSDHDEGAHCERRHVLQQTVALAAAASWSVWTLEAPASWAADDRDRPVVILGANGKTGSEVAVALATQGRPVVTLTRSGRDPFLTRQKLPCINFITHYPKPVSVTDLVAMTEAVAALKPAAIVFCASASSQGGSAAQVDDQGVGNAAQVAKDTKARFILVSALAVDRPDSNSFQMTNTLGGNYDGIMDSKFRGEERVRSTLSKDKNYVIVRPGVLMGGKTTKMGAAGIELNQGDYQGGGLSRDELAEVVVAALDNTNVRGVTVEVYRTATRTKLQPEFTKTSGNERSAATYAELFTTGTALQVD